MQAIADKVRWYRKRFRSPIFYALDSSVLWLTALLAGLIVTFLVADVYLRLAGRSYLLEAGDQWLLLAFELPMMLGMLQVMVLGAERRHRQHYPTHKRVNLRAAQAIQGRERHAFLQEHFEHQGDLKSLAKELVDDWEWQRGIKHRAQEPLWHNAVAFFKPPSASSFAAYMTGFVAVIAGIVIATMTPEVIFASFSDFLRDTWSLIWLLWRSLVFPFAACVLPGAVILTFIKNIGEWLLELLDDQYLSHMAFYRFIVELLDLHARGARTWQRRTRAGVYWTIQLGTCPINELASRWRRIQRARRLARGQVVGSGRQE